MGISWKGERDLKYLWDNPNIYLCTILMIADQGNSLSYYFALPYVASTVGDDGSA